MVISGMEKRKAEKGEGGVCVECFYFEKSDETRTHWEGDIWAEAWFGGGVEQTYLWVSYVYMIASGPGFEPK